MSLFRPEVLAHRADRLHGDVSLALPISWQVIGLGLLAALAAAITFLSLASYSRVESVSGTVTTDRGVAGIVPAHAGVVESIEVKDGQSVSTGTQLVRIRATDVLSNGEGAQTNLLSAIRAQDGGLALQARQLGLAAAAEQSRQAAAISGLSREIAGINEQLVVESQLVATAKSELDRAQEVAKNGFISRRDLQTREETWLSRRQQVSQLEASRASKASAIAEAQRAAVQIGASANAQVAGLSASRSELSQRSISTDVAQAFVVSAPVAGLVTALTARVGQTVSPQAPLMVIVPKGATLTAELEIPSTAIGFLAVGQEVRLAIDAFPYQRFGTVKARIANVSRSAVGRVDAKGATVPMYLVTAAIADPSVMAFDRRQPLLPGMALNARIVTQKQTLIEWLFEPLFAVHNR